MWLSEWSLRCLDEYGHGRLGSLRWQQTRANAQVEQSGAESSRHDMTLLAVLCTSNHYIFMSPFRGVHRPSCEVGHRVCLGVNAKVLTKRQTRLHFIELHHPRSRTRAAADKMDADGARFIRDALTDRSLADRVLHTAREHPNDLSRFPDSFNHLSRATPRIPSGLP